MKIYIDPELINDIRNCVSKDANIKELIDNCGRWMTYEKIVEEWEDFNCTPEDVISECYYIIDKDIKYYDIIDENKMLYCMVDEFLCDSIDFLKQQNKELIV